LTVAVLLVLDYVVWNWSIGASSGTVGVVTGPLLVLLAAALLLLAVRGVLRMLTGAAPQQKPRRTPVGAAGRGRTMRYRERRTATSVTTEAGGLPGYDEGSTAVTGRGSSSAKIAA
jgi:hypothetical protein